MHCLKTSKHILDSRKTKGHACEDVTDDPTAPRAWRSQKDEHLGILRWCIAAVALWGLQKKKLSRHYQPIRSNSNSSSRCKTRYKCVIPFIWPNHTDVVWRVVLISSYLIDEERKKWRITLPKMTWYIIKGTSVNSRPLMQTPTFILLVVPSEEN